MQDAITIRQVVTAWGRDTATGSRAAVLRLRYRSRGNDWGHPGSRKQPTRIAHPTLNGDQLALAGICIRLLAAEPDDEIHLIVTQSLADLINEVRQTGHASWIPEALEPVLTQSLPALKRAHTDVRPRQSFRNLFKLVRDSWPDSFFQSLEQAAHQVGSGLSTRDRLPLPVEVTEPGWTCDWGRSQKYAGAAVGLTATGADGRVIGTPKAATVPMAPQVIDGELAAVLVTNAYARVAGETCRIAYTDSRDTATHLRTFVESGRPPAYGSLLPSLAAPFTDDELLSIDVRWIYRHSTPAHRAADLAARHMSRSEHVPAESVLDLDWLLAQLADLGPAAE